MDLLKMNTVVQIQYRKSKFLEMSIIHPYDLYRHLMSVQRQKPYQIRKMHKTHIRCQYMTH